MSVIKFKEVTGDDGSFDYEARRDYTRKFYAVTNSYLDNALTILTYPACPKPFEVHPDDLGVRVTRVVPRRRAGSATIWDVDVYYSNDLKLQKPDNPLARPAEISWDPANYTQLITRNYKKKPILNTAGDPFVPATEDDRSRFVINVSKNLAKVPAWLLAYNDAINNAAIKVDGITFPKFTLRVKGVTVSAWKIENDKKFRTFSFQLHHNEQTWIRYLLNEGMREKVGTGKEARLENIRLDDRVPFQYVTRPVPLDKNGRAFRRNHKVIGADETNEMGLSLTDLVFVKAEICVPKPFSKLPLK